MECSSHRKGRIRIGARASTTSSTRSSSSGRVRFRFTSVAVLGAVVAVLVGAGPFFVQALLSTASSLSIGERGTTIRLCANRNADANANANANANNPIRVAPMVVEMVASNSTTFTSKPNLDTIGLADLRYDEWIGNSNSNSNSTPHTTEQTTARPPSRYAFRMATAEIASERSEAGAVTFLAKQLQQQQQQIVVGTAELSPIEFEGTSVPVAHQQQTQTQTQTQKHVSLYVTDVVTSSKHRRMGIANQLMDALEHYAYEHHAVATTGTHAASNDNDGDNDGDNDNDDDDSNNAIVTLYLHVKPDNPSAQSFYANPKRGYAVHTASHTPSREHEHEHEHAAGNSLQSFNFNATQLEVNAGIAKDEGQLLLSKTLTKSTHREVTKRRLRANTRSNRQQQQQQQQDTPEQNTISAATSGAMTTTTMRGFGAGLGGGGGGGGNKTKKKANKRKKR